LINLSLCHSHHGNVPAALQAADRMLTLAAHTKTT